MSAIRAMDALVLRWRILFSDLTTAIVVAAFQDGSALVAAAVVEFAENLTGVAAAN
ncbi:MAG TPA: hypothetical protein PKW35_05050 [Nannocystaceae bacterium]|nr:hypothetical protein [Nannocystaceae bacterium]